MPTDQAWPSGAVTFLFSDIEDSTPLWDRHRAAMRPALAEHDALLETAVTSNGGVIVKTTGDGVMAAFASPSAALSASLDAQRALGAAEWSTIAPDRIRVRMGLHTGEAELRAGDYHGTAVNRAARIMSIGNGGQILLSGSTAPLIQGDLPDDINLLDLGEHRLKGLNRPAHIFQVETGSLPHEFPPLRTGELPKGNLPEPLTSFVGRERELAIVERLLQETRLLTLTGAGGAGKTRLSLEAGRHNEGSYDHGVWLAELAPLSDEALVPTTVATLFDLREQPGVPIMDALADYLRGKKLLLILDNCEHLVSACARLASDLLLAAPRLTILASSREGLDMPGETAVHVPAMGVPARDIVDRDALDQFEAVRLFVDRARAKKAGFELSEANAEAVGQIVRRLDGIPLAIELAAARVKLLSPAQIAGRLDDRFHLLTGGSRTALPRQQTLRAMIDWSYDLLDEAEQWFLRQMSVFAGGWTLEAAEYVVESANLVTGFLPGAPAAGDQFPKTRFLAALDLLANLVNKSLVRVDDSGDEMRYSYLETIRQYARDRLYEAGEGPAARDRHFAYFLQMAERDYGDGIESLNDQARLTRLENDLDNLRAALEWGAGHDPVAAVDLLLYLSSIRATLGLIYETRRWSKYLLQALAELPPAPEETIAKRRLARAYALSALAGDSGTVWGGAEDYAGLEEAVAILREDGSQPLRLAGALFSLSIVSVELSRPEGYDAAREAYEIGRAWNNEAIQVLALTTMARWALIKGDMAAVGEHLAEVRRLNARIGLPLLIGQQAYVESYIARAAGDYETALRVLTEGVEALRQTRHRGYANILDSELAHTLRQSGDLAGAAELYPRTILVWQDLGHRAAVANQLESFAFIAIGEERFDRAARLLGAAEALREPLHGSMMVEEQNEYDANVVTLHKAMAPTAMQEAWQAGRGLDLDAAVDLALSGEEIDGN